MNDAKVLKLLIRSGIYEMIRDPKLLFFIIIFPLFFLAVFALVSSMMPESETLQISMLEYMFPGILVFALVSTGFFGTALPLVEMRKNGTMRLFKLAPVKRTVFIFSQIAVRFIIAVFQIALFLIIGLIIQVVHISQIVPLFFTSLIGMVMILILGFLLGGLFNKVEVAGGILGAISAPLLMLSGVLMPFYILPNIVKDISLAIPFTYLGGALRQIMFDSMSETFNIYVNISVTVGFSVLLFLVTQRTFKWVTETD